MRRGCGQGGWHRWAEELIYPTLDRMRQGAYISALERFTTVMNQIAIPFGADF